MTLIYVSQPVLQGPIADLIAKEADPANHETGFLQQELTRIQESLPRRRQQGRPDCRERLANTINCAQRRCPRIWIWRTLTRWRRSSACQEDLEERSQNLVRTVRRPEAGDQEWVFRLLKLVIKQAAYDAEQLAAVTRLPRAPTALPPQFEQSLEELLSTTRRRLTAG